MGGPPGLWGYTESLTSLLRLPLAEALSKLEAVTELDEFHARCRDFRVQYPDFAPEFTHWYLEAAPPDAAFGSTCVWLPHQMVWMDSAWRLSLYGWTGNNSHLCRQRPRPVATESQQPAAIAPRYRRLCVRVRRHCRVRRPSGHGRSATLARANYVRLHWVKRRPDRSALTATSPTVTWAPGRGKLPGDRRRVLRLERRLRTRCVRFAGPRIVKSGFPWAWPICPPTDRC